jgi:hypothetical protein
MQVQEQRLEVGPAVVALRAARAPLRIPAWSTFAIVVLAGSCGFVSGRVAPRHHYVPYVGYPLVLDTTTGKSCYSTPPKAVDNALDDDAGYPVDRNGNRIDLDPASDQSIPLCAK